jgi:hypothetical protein
LLLGAHNTTLGGVGGVSGLKPQSQTSFLQEHSLGCQILGLCPQLSNESVEGLGGLLDGSKGGGEGLKGLNLEFSWDIWMICSLIALANSKISGSSG